MSLKFLLTLAGLKLPFTTTDQLEIIHVDILQAANLITAYVPKAESGVFTDDAVVLTITPSGQHVVSSILNSKRFP